MRESCGLSRPAEVSFDNMFKSVVRQSVLYPTGPVTVHFDVETKRMRLGIEGHGEQEFPIATHNIDGPGIHPHGDWYCAEVPADNGRKMSVQFEYLFVNRARAGNERTIKLESYTPPADPTMPLHKVPPTWTTLAEITVDTKGKVIRSKHDARCPPVEITVVEAPLGGFTAETCISVIPKYFRDQAFKLQAAQAAQAARAARGGSPPVPMPDSTATVADTARATEAWLDAEQRAQAWNAKVRTEQLEKSRAAIAARAAARE